MKNGIITLVIAAALSVSAAADVRIDGFMQGLYGGRLDQSNPTATEQTASESRLQMRVEHIGDNGEFFGRLDFVYDGSDQPGYDFELREGYLKFRLGNNIDVKAGRQILTWGTGDLIFINDLFAKDYRSFFVGRDDQYLKAPQNAVRIEYYNPLGPLNLVWTPRFEPNRIPTGRHLSYYSPFEKTIVGSTGDEPEFTAPLPASKFENGEFAARFNRSVAGFNAALYFYKGFYKNPVGAVMVDGRPSPFYPRLNVYGASVRGAVWGGVLWLEGGYYDSREDQDGDDPMLPNSSASGLLGFERQIATNLTVNAQWQADMIFDFDLYRQGQLAMMMPVRDEVRHLVTSRITKLLLNENLKLSAFGFFSPTDEDLYLRLAAEYKYTDEITLAAGGNIFDGKSEATDFGQFQKNDNLYMKLTYGF